MASAPARGMEVAAATVSLSQGAKATRSAPGAILAYGPPTDPIPTAISLPCEGRKDIP
jgi:hypothetical protein